MEHIKIENTWESYYISKECKCSWNDTYCNPIKTKCDHTARRYSENSITNLLESISCGARLFINNDSFGLRLFTNNLYAEKYPNLIITKTDDCHNYCHNYYIHLQIFDTNQNKIIFSSENILSEEHKEYKKRLHKQDKYKTNTTNINNSKFQYGSTMMMENFMIIKVNVGYVIFNFKTQTYKSFMFCDLYIYNDRSVFVFVEKDEDNKITKTKIITKSDIDNNINNIMEIDFCKTIEGYGKDGIDMCCMCNSSIIIFCLTKKVADKYFSKYIYCDIRKQKNVYTSKNKFIGWRGNKFIEYDEELKRCNLISFISDDIQQIPVKNNTPKKIINCIRCLDKFEKSDEETLPEHKNVCSLCIVKL